MPLYEYACQKCDHEFEALVFDGEKVECTKCGSPKLERRFSVTARPRAGESMSLPMGCEGSGPPCGAQGCRRTG